MRCIWPVVSLIVAAGLQGNFPSSLAIWGAKPDFILVVLIAYALAADPAFGAGLGFIAGLIHGSIVGVSLGSFIVTRTIAGFLAGLTTTRLFGDNPVVPVLSTVWLTVAVEGLFLLANPRPDLVAVGRTLAGECIYNAALAFVLCLFFRYAESRRKNRLINARL